MKAEMSTSVGANINDGVHGFAITLNNLQNHTNIVV